MTATDIMAATAGATTTAAGIMSVADITAAITAVTTTVAADTMDAAIQIAATRAATTSQAAITAADEASAAEADMVGVRIPTVDQAPTVVMAALTAATAAGIMAVAGTKGN